MSAIKVSEDVREVLRKSVITENEVRLPGQLDRKLYVDVDKVLKGYGGKWNRGRVAHVFDGDPREKLAEVLAGGNAVNEQQRDQAFYTPARIADLVVGEVKLSGSMHVLEPSVGEGALVEAIFRLGIRPRLTICDMRIDPVNRFLARHEEIDVTVIIADFLIQKPCSPRGGYDAIVMNPPFTNGQDMKHVAHALRFLRPGGEMAAIMSPAWTFRSDKATKTFREILEGYEHEWSPLPPGSFKESGTNVETGILRIARP